MIGKSVPIFVWPIHISFHIISFTGCKLRISAYLGQHSWSEDRERQLTWECTWAPWNKTCQVSLLCYKIPFCWAKPFTRSQTQAISPVDSQMVPCQMQIKHKQWLIYIHAIPNQFSLKLSMKPSFGNFNTSNLHHVVEFCWHWMLKSHSTFHSF